MYAKKLLGSYLPALNEQKAFKYMKISRMLYFFSSVTLAYTVFFIHIPKHAKEKLESGMPLLEDERASFGRLRRKGIDEGDVIEYRDGEGWVHLNYNKEEYLERLRAKAMEKAKQTQLELLAKGKPLPKGSIDLTKT